MSIVAGIAPEDSSLDSGVSGRGSAAAPPAIWFTRLLLLVQGTILAIGTTLALAEAARSQRDLSGVPAPDALCRVVESVQVPLPLEASFLGNTLRTDVVGLDFQCRQIATRPVRSYPSAHLPDGVRCDATAPEAWCDPIVNLGSALLEGSGQVAC